MAGHDWDESYASDFLPWDTGVPDPMLTDAVDAGVIAPGRTLEVGCGTGTNARWLAERGFDVLAVDVSPRAIERARAGGAAGCRFEVHDFLAAPPAGAFDLVFDRGCFHSFDDPGERATFAAHVAAVLAPAGVWLSMIGSTEGAPRDHGPPRRTARDILAAVEPVLELVELRSAQFNPEVDAPPMAWRLLARVRSLPAQPSTRRG